ncbi:MAG: hypothetical protein C0392_13680 [Syntrophus sp. (in: bacteria)]|nr:hypothetical protein [Syntrophus sp. (in: bacteria)]
MAIKSKPFNAVLCCIIALCSFIALPAQASETLPVFQRMALPNGLILILKEEHSLPFVTMKLLVDGGPRKDPVQQEGVSHLTARSLLLGTSARTAQRINHDLDYTGAALVTSVDRDYMTLTLRVLKKDLEKGFGLFLDTLIEPVFPEDELKREIGRILAAIQSQEDNPGWIAETEFEKTLFLNTPYGHPVEGTKETLKGITRDQVIKFHRTFYHPNNAVLAVIGDITLEEIKTRLFPGLLKWQKGIVSENSFRQTYSKGPKAIKIHRSVTQANITMGNEGISRSNPDYYAVMVMNYILGGGGFSSRLMEEIRNKRGFAYSATSAFESGKLPGDFQVTLQTKNASAREAINLAVKEMEKMRKGLVSEKELEGAKRYLIGSLPLRFDSQAKLASFIVHVEFYGLGLDYPRRYPALIGAVTREEIRRVAQTYIHPDKLITVIVGDLKEAGME